MHRTWPATGSEIRLRGLREPTGCGAVPTGLEFRIPDPIPTNPRVPDPSPSPNEPHSHTFGDIGQDISMPHPGGETW